MKDRAVARDSGQQDDTTDPRDGMVVVRRLTFEFREDEEIDSFRIRILTPSRKPAFTLFTGSWV